MSRKMFALRLVICGILLAALGARGVEFKGTVVPIPPAEQILKTLNKEHPRLLMTAANFARLKKNVQSEEPLHTWYTNLQQEAESILSEPPSKYELPDGLRLLYTSRRVRNRVLTLALLYRLDGDKRYADRAWRELDAAAHFKDWNARHHFLDTAEMTCAFGIGYDWLYNYWTPAQREELRTAMIEKGIEPAMRIEEHHSWWSVMNNNWNQVCNGGVGVGALAIADEDPQLAGDFLHAALESIQLPMIQYGPDGAWPEGPGYWNYATSYNVLFLAALKTALGTDFGLTTIKGFSEAGTFPIFDSGPTGLSFNYADAGAGVIRAPEMFWLAREFDRPDYGWHQLQVAEGSPLDMIWYGPRFARRPAAPPPLDKYYRHTEVVTMRSAWNDANALFVGFKGGDNKFNHSHLDLGSFVLDALGERWVMDLGSDNYNLPGYFDVAGGKRWTYYRLRAEGHNTLVLNPGYGPDQNPHAVAPIIKFESKPEKAFAIANLTAAYANSAEKVERGVAMLNRNTVLVQDEIEAIKPAELWWFLHTRAEIEIARDGSSAILTRHGKHLTVNILAPKNARFEERFARPLPTSPHPGWVMEPQHQSPKPLGPIHQRTNRGIRVLAIHLKNVTALRLAIAFTPQTNATNAVAALPPIKPLVDW